MLTEFDFHYAMENTQVLHEPDRRIDTFGSTPFEFQLISELMDQANVTRVREGRIDAQKPLILKPEGYENWDFEGFGEEGQAFGEWFKDHLKNIAVLRYGFLLTRSDISEQLVHEPMAAVSARLVETTRSNGNPMRAVIQGVDDTWEISLLKFTLEMIQKSQQINLFDFKRRGLLAERRHSAMSRLKILLFLFVVTLAGAVIAGTYWVYTRVLGHDVVVQKEIKRLEGKKSVPPDPGIKRFDHAVEILKSGDLHAAHDAFYDLLWHFPESARAREARRIVGEMNMDALFSRDENPEKTEYTVQPRGDVLNSIAHKNQTTVACLLRANGMMSTMLHPGDHLTVFPLDFEILVSLGAKTLTLLHNDRFFKDYAVVDVKMLPGMKIPTVAGKLELSIKDSAAWVQGKRVIPTDPLFNDADKWLMTAKVGFNVRSLPQAKPVNPEQTTIEPHKIVSGTKKTPKTPKPPRTVKHGKPPPKALAGGDDDDATAGVPETGVFLAREDMEELYILIRTGTKLTLVR